MDQGIDLLRILFCFLLWFLLLRLMMLVQSMR